MLTHLFVDGQSIVLIFTGQYGSVTLVFRTERCFMQKFHANKTAGWQLASNYGTSTYIHHYISQIYNLINWVVNFISYVINA